MTPASTPPGARPLHLVVMGVAGTGKSAVARALVDRLGWPFAEGDDFHLPTNVEKMASGRPLVDEDRWPWLESLAAWAAEHDARGRDTVMTCSALRRDYRELLRRGGRGTYFVHLVGGKELLLQRMGARTHFMPPSLLESQLDALEPLRDDEPGMVVDVVDPPARIAQAVLAQLDLPEARGG